MRRRWLLLSTLGMLYAFAGTSVLATPTNDLQTHRATAGGLTWEYARSGRGPAIVLLHGWPEDWSAWRHVMPVLARRFDVIAIDLPGVGGTSVPDGGAEKAIVAQRVRALLQQLGVKNPYVVGHDVGAQVAYAYLRQYPQDIRGAMLLETAILGLGSTKSHLESLPLFWHFNFYEAPGLAEHLIDGKQQLYFRYFLYNGMMAAHRAAVSEADVRRYAHAYNSVQRLRTTFDEYRVFDADQRWNSRQRTAISTPITLVAGDHALASFVPPMATAMHDHGLKNIATETVQNSGHYILDEQPAAVAALIDRRASEPPR